MAVEVERLCRRKVDGADMAVEEDDGSELAVLRMDAGKETCCDPSLKQWKRRRSCCRMKRRWEQWRRSWRRRWLVMAQRLGDSGTEGNHFGRRMGLMYPWAEGAAELGLVGALVEALQSLEMAGNSPVRREDEVGAVQGREAHGGNEGGAGGSGAVWRRRGLGPQVKKIKPCSRIRAALRFMCSFKL